MKTKVLCITLLLTLASMSPAFQPNFKNQSTIRQEEMRSHKGDEAFAAQHDLNQGLADKSPLVICETPDCHEGSANKARTKGHTEAYQEKFQGNESE